MDKDIAKLWKSPTNKEAWVAHVREVWPSKVKRTEFLLWLLYEMNSEVFEAFDNAFFTYIPNAWLAPSDTFEFDIKTMNARRIGFIQDAKHAFRRTCEPVCWKNVSFEI